VVVGAFFVERTRDARPYRTAAVVRRATKKHGFSFFTCNALLLLL